MTKPDFSFLQKMAAWSVHIFTASGLLAAFMALVAIDQGDWKACWLWLFLCFVIDGVDGTFARMANVKAVLPQIDGKYIDYVIDFAAYAIIPAFFFYKTSMTSDGLMIWSIGIMLLSAALYYGKSDMTGGGSYFIGFPVLWNLVVFLLFFAIDLGPTGNFLAILFFGILHFIPLKYAYPSQAKRFFWAHMIATLVGAGTGGYVLYQYPTVIAWPKWVIVAVMSWFLIMAIIETYDDHES